MNRTDSLERELAAWLSDTAAPRMPEFRNDLLQQTAGMRQRPRWSFPERWLPMTVITAGRRTFRPIPWRTVALLALLAMLLAATTILFVGSRPRPAPLLGPAANGLVAYADDGGDIYTVDPVGGARHVVISGQTPDHAPRFSLDGTRFLFLRGNGHLDVPVIAEADGRNELVTNTAGLTNANPDSIVWSPDGRTVALLADVAGVAKIHLIDASDGSVVVPPLDYIDGELTWRPPDGRALMFTQGSEGDEELAVYSLDTGDIEVIATPRLPGAILRGQGWTADGEHLAYFEADDRNLWVTRFVDVATGSSRELRVGYGELSNDGRRVAGLHDETGALCVIPVDGTTCEPITGPQADGWGWNYRWSPDDSAILTTRNDGAELVLDPDAIAPEQPAWMQDGGESWQRRAP